MWFSICIETSNLKLVIISGKITIVNYITFVREEVQTVDVVKIGAANCKQTRKQLEFLQKIYETVPCGIVQYTNDDECKVINANQAACNIHEGVKKVSDIVAEFLRNIGFLTRTINFPNAGNMLVAEYGDMTKPFVIITGHMAIGDSLISNSSWCISFTAITS